MSDERSLNINRTSQTPAAERAALGRPAVVGGRQWFLRRRGSAWMAYLSIGLLATIVLEWLSTEVWRRWAYTPEAPRLPGLGTGLVPLLQWLLLPPLVAWLAAGQIRGHSERPLSKE